MSEPLHATTVGTTLTEWLFLASDISNELSDRESRGWRGDPNRSEKPMPENLLCLSLKGQEITAWRDTGGCTCDPDPLLKLESLLLQRSRHYKPERFAEVYEEGIPSAEEQLRLFENASRTVFRMLAVVKSAAVITRDAPDVNEEGYLGLIVEKENHRVRRQGADYKHAIAEFEADSAQWHTFWCAWQSGPKGATKEQWLNGYGGNNNSQSRRQVKRLVNEKLRVLDVKLENRVPPMLIDNSTT